MKSFYAVLSNTLIAATTNNFIWFALTFWAYLETKSVISTSFVTGIYLLTTLLSGIWFGSIVDHNKKKTAMMLSSIVSLIFFSIATIFYLLTPETLFKSIENYQLWVFALLLMLGVIPGNIRNIVLPTITTILVPEKDRDKANGMSGTVMGISFAITSVASGLVLAYGGMFWALVVTIGFTLLSIIHLLFISIPEKQIVHAEGVPQKIDLRGTIAVVAAIPGLFALLFFNTFNNFLGGVFMSLMDAYGLTLVSVQVWGTLWGVLSFGFILGGLIVAKKGLGKNPLKTLLLSNIVMWVISIFFTIQPSIILMAIGMLFWMTLVPFVEAAEQTILQKVVPPERQGRVFGFAQSLEQAASPVTAFFIGPIAQLIFIPYMTTGSGVDLIGTWFGTGPGRGMALVFIISGVIGLIVTLLALQTNAYKLLSRKYKIS